MTRVCNACKLEKGLDEFGTTRSRSRSGEKGPVRPRSHCKLCISMAHRLRKYGITAEQYMTMVRAQNNLCLLCGEPEPREGGLVIDHDHKTDRVRGLLCHPCNQRLGIWEKYYDQFSSYLEASDAHVHGLDCGTKRHLPEAAGGGGNCARWPYNLVGV